MTGKPKTKSYQPSTNPLKMLFSITTPFEFVSKYSFDECLERLAAQRTKNPPSRLEQKLHNIPVITVEISQDGPDSAKFVLKDHTDRLIRGYHRNIEGKLTKLTNATLVQTSVLALGGPFILSVGLGLWVLFSRQVMPRSVGIFILVSVVASLLVFFGCLYERHALFSYIRILFAYDPVATWSKAHPSYKTPKLFRLVDDGEVIPIEEQAITQTPHHGSNSK